jgi:hypothetical protein
MTRAIVAAAMELRMLASEDVLAYPERYPEEHTQVQERFFGVLHTGLILSPQGLRERVSNTDKST